MTTPARLARPSHVPTEQNATTEPGGRGTAPSRAHPEVVVGILDDLGAIPLVHRALAEATTRGAGVRVVRVLPPGSEQREVLAADSLAYAVTRAALTDGTTAPSRFEVAVGDPVEVLLERARDATLLVVGADHDGSTVAHRCRAEATCPVLVGPDQ